MIKLPGLIDPHVHLRDPGATHKEDFSSGTAAALAGGFSMVLAMPNTQPPLTDAEPLERAKGAARGKARCDYGLFLGAGAGNQSYAHTLADRVCGLKMYLDQTYGPLQLDDLNSIRRHVENWPNSRPLAVHAEGRSLAAMLLLARLVERPVHICHVSRKDEILLIRAAREKGFPVTCEVTPHHLFLTDSDKASIGEGRAEVRPHLATAEDQQSLWDNLDVIDCFATDHAPHTLEEKDSEQSPPGFPGLETALGLYLTAVHQGRLTREQLIARCYDNPRRIFGLQKQPETWIEVDPDLLWDVQGSALHSRCGWTPFEGMPLRGKVLRCVLRGQTVYENDQVVAPPGTGMDLAPMPE